MKYYIIAGEASGDLHGSNLMKCLKERDSSAVFRYWGGDLMYSQGGELVKHIESLAFMGFKEVLMNIRTIKRNFELCYADLLNFSPDVLILIDYPGFNLKVAEFAFKHEIKVFYYISPQIWAWKQSRIKKIKKFVNRMFVILPFEKDFYGRFDFPVDYVGHPLLDAIQEQLDISSDFNLFIRSNDLERKKIIALLPGSRKQEIQLKLPVMLSITEHFDDEYQFVIAAAPSVDKSFYEKFLENNNSKILYGKTYEILKHSCAAIVTSGTATLETALFNVPEIVCYRSGNISYHIAKRLIKVKYISLVNLIMEKAVVKELIQSDLNTRNLIDELEKLLHNELYRQEMFINYSELRRVLGGKGASCRVADLMYKYLNE